MQRFCTVSFTVIALGFSLTLFGSADANAQASGITAKPLLRNHTQW